MTVAHDRVVRYRRLGREAKTAEERAYWYWLADAAAADHHDEVIPWWVELIAVGFVVVVAVALAWVITS